MSQQKLIGVFVLNYQFKTKNLIFEDSKHLTRPQIVNEYTIIYYAVRSPAPHYGGEQRYISNALIIYVIMAYMSVQTL